MRRFRRAAPRDFSRRRVWIYIAVGLFLLADIYLVSTALTSTRAETVLPVGTPRATLTPTTAPTLAPSPTASAAITVSPVPATRILSAVSSTVAWRAVTGTCPDPLAELGVSTDAGRTWL